MTKEREKGKSERKREKIEGWNKREKKYLCIFYKIKEKDIKKMNIRQKKIQI